MYWKNSRTSLTHYRELAHYLSVPNIPEAMLLIIVWLLACNSIFQWAVMQKHLFLFLPFPPASPLIVVLGPIQRDCFGCMVDQDTKDLLRMEGVGVMCHLAYTSCLNRNWPLVVWSASCQSNVSMMVCRGPGEVIYFYYLVLIPCLEAEATGRFVSQLNQWAWQKECMPYCWVRKVSNSS